MKIYFTIDNNCYLNGVSSTSLRVGNEYSVEVEKDHEVLCNPDIFKFEDGQLIKDEERQKQLIKEGEMENNKLSDDEMNALAIMELTEKIMGGK